MAGATCILYYTVRPSRPAYGTLFAVIEKEVQFHETEQVPAHNTLALRSSWLRWQRRGAALAHPRTVPQARVEVLRRARTHCVLKRRYGA